MHMAPLKARYRDSCEDSAAESADTFVGKSTASENDDAVSSQLCAIASSGQANISAGTWELICMKTKPLGGSCVGICTWTWAFLRRLSGQMLAWIFGQIFVRRYSCSFAATWGCRHMCIKVRQHVDVTSSCSVSCCNEQLYCLFSNKATLQSALFRKFRGGKVADCSRIEAACILKSHDAGERAQNQLSARVVPTYLYSVPRHH